MPTEKVTHPRWIQNLVGGVTLVALLGFAVAWGALGQRVAGTEKKLVVVEETKEKVAVVENEVKHIKEDVKEVKKDVKEVLRQLRKINGGN
jgi:adenylosuccinate lyase